MAEHGQTRRVQGPLPLVDARVQISLPANSICDVKAGFGNPKWKSRKEDFNRFSDTDGIFTLGSGQKKQI